MEPAAEARKDVRSPFRLTKDHLLVSFVFLFLSAVTFVPLIYGASLSHGRVFTWSPASNTFDYSYYLSYMRQGADGLWRVQNLSVIDQQTSDINHLFYVVSGHLASLMAISIPAMYQVARILAIGSFIVILWGFIARRLDRQSQILALLMVCFSSGFGWTGFGQAANSADLWLNDMTTFTTLYFWPHITYALALKSLAIFSLFAALDRKDDRCAIVAGLSCAFLAFDHPFDLYGIALVYGAYAVVRIAGSRADALPMIRHLAITALVASPFVGYMYLQYSHNPLLVYRSSINVEAVPKLGELLSGFGLVGILALVPLVGRLAALRTNLGADLELIAGAKLLGFLYTWAFATVIGMYVLSGSWFARRLILGMHVPLAILAAIGVMALARIVFAHSASWQRLALGMAVAAATFITNFHIMRIEMLGYESGLGRAIGGTCRLYLEQREIDRLKAIGSSAPPDAFVQPLPSVVNGAPDLTLISFGPWLTGHHQICGHPFETPNYLARLQKLLEHAEKDQGVVVGGRQGTQVLPL